MEHNAASTTDFEQLKLFSRGKVRDVYEVGDSLLIVTTDRISAFDVIMTDPVPEKGKILTQMSTFWFREMVDIIPNHIPPEGRPPFRWNVLYGDTSAARDGRITAPKGLFRGCASLRA